MLIRVKRFLVRILKCSPFSKVSKLFIKLLPKRFRNKLNNVLKLPEGKKHLPYTPLSYPEGVNLFGYLKAQMGLGQGARLYARAIINSGLPYKLLNVTVGNPANHNEQELKEFFSKQPLYNTNIIHINPEQMPSLHLVYPHTSWDKRYNICVWLWELEDWPVEWMNAFDYADEIWTPSVFTTNAIKKVSPIPVTTVPYGIHTDTDDRFNREYFRLPQDRFLFLCMFDVNSTMERKNPFGAIDSFLSAFNKNNSDVGLVVKINNANPTTIDMLKSYTEGNSNIIIFDSSMDKMKVHSLIEACDTFVSLHRSEGFGLVMAEAMCLGVPVIATNWSANTDFMKADNSCLVDFKFIDVGSNYFKAKPGQRWADPNIEHAAFYMKKLFSDKSFYNRIAQSGRKSISAEFSLNKSADKMIKRLEEIGLITGDVFKS